MRVFLGLDPSEGLRADLALQEFLLPMPRRVAPEDLHLTLIFCGDVSDSQLDGLHRRLSELRAGAFDLSLSGFGLFGGHKPHAAWVGLAPSDPLEALQLRVGNIARQEGLDLPHRRFVPHITLGRFPRPDPAMQMRLERAIAEGAGYRAGPWRVEEMVLWQSELTGAGPRYTALARYAFADARRPPPGDS